MVKISVVIPVKNSGKTLEECILAVRAGTFHDYEIIVVDDLSSDNSIDIARKHSCTVIKSHSPHGVSAARNTGAAAAGADIILFIDADILIEKDSLDKIMKIYNEKNVDAVVGVQSEFLRYTNFLSQFKNLWMRYTYLSQPDYVSLFYTSMASIKKDIFLAMGGFDENYRMPNVEDTDFGQKLAMKGVKILLARELAVEHLKGYNFWSILKTDYYRARGLIKMTMRRGAAMFSGGNKTSVPNTYIMQVIFFMLFFFLLLSFAVTGEKVFLLAGLFFFLVIFLANISFLNFLKKKKGAAFALAGFFFIVSDNLAVAAGLITGFVSYLFGSRYY